MLEHTVKQANKGLIGNTKQHTSDDYVLTSRQNNKAAQAEKHNDNSSEPKVQAAANLWLVKIQQNQQFQSKYQWFMGGKGMEREQLHIQVNFTKAKKRIEFN